MKKKIENEQTKILCN